MRWSLWAVRFTILAVNLLIAAIIILSILPFATGDLRVEIPDTGQSEPTFENNKMTMAIPIDIYNGGYFNIEDLQLRLNVTDGDQKVTDYITEPVDIRTGEMTHLNIKLEVDLNSIPQSEMERLVFNTTELAVNVQAQAAYSLNLIKATINVQQTIDWEPLISNYEIHTNEVQVTPNGTNVDVMIPYSFTASDLIQGRELYIMAQLKDDTSIVSTAYQNMTIQQNNQGEFRFTVSQLTALWLMATADDLTLAMDISSEGMTVHQESTFQWGS